MIKRFIKGKTLLAHWLFAFLITWGILTPGVLSTLGLIDFNYEGTVLTMLSVVGPFFSALLVTYITNGTAGIKKFFTRIIKPEKRKGWMAVSLFLFTYLFMVSAIAYLFMGGGFPSPRNGLFLNGGNVILVFLLLLFGSFGEEIGWRGFALPKLQKRYKPIKAAFILTIIWWLWHIPTYWTLPYAINAEQQFGFFIAFGMQFIVLFALSIICSWVYNGSKGNVLTAVFIHVTWNFWVGSFGEQASLMMMPLLLISAIAIVIITKGKLGLADQSKL